MPKAPREKSRLSLSRTQHSSGQTTKPAINQLPNQSNNQIVPGSAASAVQALIQSITGVSNDETATFAARLFAGLSNPSTTQSVTTSADVPATKSSVTQAVNQSGPVKQQTKAAKREAKHARLMTKLGLPGSKKQQKVSQAVEQPAKSSIDLSELRSQLPLAAVLDPRNNPSKNHSANQLKTTKSRARLRAAEISQLTSVLSHPAYTASPMEAMRTHLEAMAAKAKSDEREAEMQIKTDAKVEKKRQELSKAIHDAPISKAAKRRAAKKAKNSVNSMFD